jgi:hypothetical protein
LLAVAVPAPGAAEPPGEGEPRDSLEIFLDKLRRESDERFGEATVRFDTTGFDSLLQERLAHPPPVRLSRDRYLQPEMVLRYDRAEGFVLGSGVQLWSRPAGTIHAKAAYAFGSEAVLHEVGWRRILWLGSGYGFADRRDVSRDWSQGGVSLFGVEVSYAREGALFAFEHAQPGISTLNAFFLGTDRQGYYERRGVEASARLRHGGLDVIAGYRDGKEKALARNADFALFRDDAKTPGVRPAGAGTFRHFRLRAAYEPDDRRHAALLEGQGLGNDGWRLRGVAGSSVGLGRTVKALVQLEGGAARTTSPAQRRFEIGGPRAVASLPYGEGSTDHLLLGKLEFLHSASLLDWLRLPRPDFFDLSLGAFFHYGVAWDDPGRRDIVFSMPPSAGWRGAAGLSLLYRPGLPDPRTFWRFQLGWPVGPDAGDMRLTLAIGREFDLVGRP